MSGTDSAKIAESALRRSGFEGAAPETVETLARYLHEVGYWSGKVHLVGKGSLGSSLGLLVLDSLALLGAVEARGIAAARAADIGSGAGFPGLVWKIVRPRMAVTLYERRLKPQLFLERTVIKLGLAGIAVVGEDAANAAEAGTFDLVASKAAGRLDEMLPLAERLLAPGGAYATLKGRAWEGELPERIQSAMRLEAAVELPERRGAALIFRKSLPK
jgi:16S rRNA (guanine527-N7)-methyltransferase